MNTAPLHIAYVLKGFPRLSETFITHELLQMQSLGAELRLFSIKAGDDGPRHASVDRIRTPVRYLPRVGSLSATRLHTWLADHLPRFAASQRYLLRRAPRGHLRALGWALKHAWQHRNRDAGGLKKTYIKEFLQAGEIAAALLREPGPRLIHAHFCHDATNVAWMASLITGLPFSFTAHAKDIYQARLNPGRLLEDKIAAARFVVTCTEANRTHLVARTPHSNKVHRVYHGLDVEAFKPGGNACGEHCAPSCEQPGAPSQEQGVAGESPATNAPAGVMPAPAFNQPHTRPLVLAVGRRVEKKGFVYLIEACGMLRDRGFDFECAIVGERGDAQGAIEARIRELDLQAHVTLVPAMTQERLRALYARATAFAMPSVILDDGDRDGIPNVLAEAMAMGVPTVATPISGIPELISDGVDGLLAPERNAQALADSLARLLAEPELRSRLARNGRTRVLGTFDASHTHRELHRLFAEAGA